MYEVFIKRSSQFIVEQKIPLNMHMDNFKKLGLKSPEAVVSLMVQPTSLLTTGILDVA